MLRFYIGFIFFALYSGWVVYRMFVKKDIKQHKGEFHVYSLFAGIWAVIYGLFFLAIV